MKLDSEQQWKELVEEATLKRWDFYCDDSQAPQEFRIGARFVEDNLSRVPKVRELLDALEKYKNISASVQNLDMAAREALEKFRGQK